MIYLDSNATTPVDPRVLEVMDACHRRFCGNPASAHRAGQAARGALEAAREQIGRFLNARAADVRGDRILFTSGGTEANNLAILGRSDRPGQFLISAIEHPSVVAAANYLQDQGREVVRLPVDSGGVLRLEALARALEGAQTALVAIMLGNNETGVLQPVAEAARLCRQRQVPLHTDAVQVVGKLPVDFAELGVDSLTLSGHKFHGPPGVAALLLRAGCRLQPLLHGGFQQFGLRPGSENTALACGLAEALQLAGQEGEARPQRMAELRNLLEQRIRQELPETVVVGREASRLPHTSCLSFPGLDRQALLMALDLAGVACSTGSACASGSSEPSPVLLAMGLTPPVVAGALRFSLHAATRREEIVEAAHRIIGVVVRLRQADAR